MVPLLISQFALFEVALPYGRASDTLATIIKEKKHANLHCFAQVDGEGDCWS
jgi:hypothetical protein